jgi:hypothetical protein
MQHRKENVILQAGVIIVVMFFQFYNLQVQSEIGLCLPKPLSSPLSGGSEVVPRKMLKFYIAVGEFWHIFEARIVSGQCFRREKLLVGLTCVYCEI